MPDYDDDEICRDACGEEIAKGVYLQAVLSEDDYYDDYEGTIVVVEDLKSDSWEAVLKLIHGASTEVVRSDFLNDEKITLWDFQYPPFDLWRVINYHPPTILDVLAKDLEERK